MLLNEEEFLGLLGFDGFLHFLALDGGFDGSLDGRGLLLHLADLSGDMHLLLVVALDLVVDAGDDLLCFVGTDLFSHLLVERFLHEFDVVNAFESSFSGGLLNVLVLLEVGSVVLGERRLGSLKHGLVADRFDLFDSLVV